MSEQEPDPDLSIQEIIIFTRRRAVFLLFSSGTYPSLRTRESTRTEDFDRDGVMGFPIDPLSCLGAKAKPVCYPSIN